MGKYDDIIGLKRPVSNRSNMDVSDRAKIFMPFAALKGYDEAIGEINNTISARNELYTQREIIQEFGDEI